MCIYIFIILTIAVYTLYRYFKDQLSFFEKLQIPYIPGWPIVGNLAKFCFGRKHIIEIIHDIYNVHPEAKYVGAFNFIKPTIVLRDLELIKSITIRHFDHFSERPLRIDDTADPIFGGNLFFIGGDRWRQMKSVLTPTFTSSKMKAMHELIVDCANSFMNYLDEMSDVDRQSIATKDLFSRVTNDVIVSCAFGISTDSLRNPENEIYILGKEVTRLDGIRLIKLVLFGMFPKLANFLRLKLVKKRTADFFTKIVASAMQERDKKGINRPDMIQMMMNARDKAGEKLDATKMTAQAFAFYFGGFETVSTQMCLLAHELAINPDVQQKLQVEIDQVMMETNGKPSYEDIQRMLYLDATSNESMRLHTQFVFLERLCVKPFELSPTLPGRETFTIPKGMPVWVPAPAINRDPKYFENPTKFDPDRYYMKKASASEVSNIGFGMGPRGCLGARFATLEMKIIFTYLLSNFNLVPTERTCSPLKYDKRSFTVKPIGGFFLKLQPRNE